MSSKILCTEAEVALKSLPRCLRHCGKGDSIQEAIQIAKMLHILFMSLEDDGWTDRKDGLKGLELVLELLLDKLEIAAGEYKFPFLAYGEDVPALVEREKEAAA